MTSEAPAETRPGAECSRDVPFVAGPVSIGVQSVLYGNNAAQVRRAIASLARAAELAIGEGLATSVSLRLGDSSPRPCLPADFAQEEFQRHREILGVEYDFFDGNLGSAGGHNRLAAGNKADMLLIQNPDVLIGPRALGGLLDCFRKPGVGMAEAKQLPIEHPKDYDPVTGECSWATTACAMVPAPLFRKIGGFDADSFFLYCDDVDYSWLTRLEGYSVIFQPAATAFHDKRLAADASWAPSASERYYSAEAALFSLTNGRVSISSRNACPCSRRRAIRICCGPRKPSPTGVRTAPCQLPSIREIRSASSSITDTPNTGLRYEFES